MTNKVEMPVYVKAMLPGSRLRNWSIDKFGPLPTEGQCRDALAFNRPNTATAAKAMFALRGCDSPAAFKAQSIAFISDATGAVSPEHRNKLTSDLRQGRYVGFDVAGKRIAKARFDKGGDGFASLVKVELTAKAARFDASAVLAANMPKPKAVKAAKVDVAADDVAPVAPVADDAALTS